MSRVRYTTTIQEDLLDMAKVKAAEVGLDGANDVIEQALRIYFSNSSVEVWEKPLQGGWTKKMVIRSSSFAADFWAGYDEKPLPRFSYNPDSTLEPPTGEQAGKGFSSPFPKCMSATKAALLFALRIDIMQNPAATFFIRPWLYSVVGCRRTD